MESRGDMPLFPLQPRRVTIGEILARAENRDQNVNQPPNHTFSLPYTRTMSPTRRLGPLASGRPRRPRTLSRPSRTHIAEDEPRPRRSRRQIEALRRRQAARTDARIQNIIDQLNRPRPWIRPTARSSTSRTNRSRHQNVARRINNPFALGLPRSNTVGNRQSRTSNAGLRSGRQYIQRTTLVRPAQSSSSFSRIIDVYETQVVQRPTPHRSSFMTPRNSGRSRIGRGASTSRTVPANVQRFMDFTAEFLPLQPHPPDAEPPEWSLEATTADFGPFAIGRSAVSRNRSLAVIAALL